MENWGCITYRETALLVSSTSSVRDLRYVTQIIAHEMAHQWFGNLVTLDWWNDLWLNEGFASYFEYFGASAAHPEFAYYRHFFAEDMPAALRFDSQRNSHPMSSKADSVNSTDSIESLFDKVSYERGSAILRMLRAWLNKEEVGSSTYTMWEEAPRSNGTDGAMEPSHNISTDPFFVGIHRYLAVNALNTTTATKLWQNLGPASGIDLEAIMEDWTYHQGYPLLTVTMDAKRNVWIQQAPFNIDGVGHCQSTVGAAWWIPVAFTSSEAPRTVKWAEVNACQTLRSLLTLPKGGWIKVNAYQYGYYRVNYQSDLWNSLIDAAKEVDASGVPIITDVDLSGLLEDSFALAEADVIKIDVFLRLLEALPERSISEYAPWAVAFPKLHRMQQLVPCTDAWVSYVRDNILESFFENANETLTSNGDPPIQVSFLSGQSFDAGNVAHNGSGSEPNESASEDSIGFKLLWPLLLRYAGILGDSNLKTEASTMVSELAKRTGTTVDLDADLRTALYQTAARTSDVPQDTFEDLLQLYDDSVEASERDRLLRSLAYSSISVPEILKLSLTDSVRAQDITTLVITTATAIGETRVREVWDWFRDTDNWVQLHEKLGGDDEASRRMGKILEEVASALAETKAIDEVDALFIEHSAQQSEAGYSERAKEAIMSNIRWIEEHGDDTCAWVEKKRR